MPDDPPPPVTVPGPSAAPVDPLPAQPPTHQTTVVIPGSSARASREIQDVSPEGRPADAKAGPGSYWLILTAMLLAFLVLMPLIVAAIFGWGEAGLAFVVGAVAAVLAPMAWVVVERGKDREEVLEHRDHMHRTLDPDADPTAR